MNKKHTIILPMDREYAVRRIEELNREIQELGPEFYDVFNQSSETWHDNAPFDALRDRQSVLDAERHSLKRILQSASPSIPKQFKNKVGIGSRVKILDSKGKSFRYLVAGDWTPRAGEKENGLTIISRSAPLAQVLYGREVGDVINFRDRNYTIEDLEYVL